MFNIREVLKVDVYVIGDTDRPAGTHAVTRAFVDELDEFLSGGRGVLKIPATPGHFNRYPVQSVTNVVDYAQNDYSRATVELHQGHGHLYLVDPETEQAYQLPAARIAGDSSPEAVAEIVDDGGPATFGSDTYNLAEQHVTIDELGVPTVGTAAEAHLAHLATYQFAGARVVAGPDILQAGLPAIAYLGEKQARELALDVPIPQRRRTEA